MITNSPWRTAPIAANGCQKAVSVASLMAVTVRVPRRVISLEPALLGHDVHRGLLRRRRATVDPGVERVQLGVVVERAVRGDQAAGAHVADLVVEQLTVGVGRVAEIVSPAVVAVGELTGQPPVERLAVGRLTGGGAPPGARPRLLRRRPAFVEHVGHTAVVQGVLRLEDTGVVLVGSVLGIHAARVAQLSGGTPGRGAPRRRRQAP
ncbi:hypothetical protein BJF90_39890 [Pseudonocardia sp. CNS-004]|nr:hypothetical protein BJF90_39890 [Pseudonocardia sp. CNS-004]